MFLPELFHTIQCKPFARKVFSNSEELLQRLLVCHQDQFSGYLTLTLSENQVQPLNLYFFNGLLVGSTGGSHPVRCWHRQVVRYCPQLSHEIPLLPSDPSQLCNYSLLAQRLTQRQLSQSQMSAVIRGYLSERLFDFIQTQHSGNHIAAIQVVYYDFCQKITNSPPALVQPGHVLQQATQFWHAWSRAGLQKFSPNLAPMIQHVEALQQQTSPLVFDNLTQLIDGNHTLRDLAAKRKQHLLLLTRSIMPYVTQGMMGLVAVPDAVAVAPACLTQKNPIQPVLYQSARPLVAYIEDSRFDSKAMEQILRKTGCRFTSISDSIQALPWLLEQKPDLIFLDVLMPNLSGYEVCTLIQQISMLKNTPVIIVSSRDGLVDQAQAKTVGASDFLAKPITSEKVLAILQKYLPIPPSPSQPTGYTHILQY